MRSLGRNILVEISLFLTILREKLSAIATHEAAPIYVVAASYLLAGLIIAYVLHIWLI
jgi:hypothetical protein